MQRIMMDTRWRVSAVGPWRAEININMRSLNDPFTAHQYDEEMLRTLWDSVRKELLSVRTSTTHTTVPPPNTQHCP